MPCSLDSLASRSAWKPATSMGLGRIEVTVSFSSFEPTVSSILGAGNTPVPHWTDEWMKTLQLRSSADHLHFADVRGILPIRQSAMTFP